MWWVLSLILTHPNDSLMGQKYNIFNWKRLHLHKIDHIKIWNRSVWKGNKFDVLSATRWLYQICAMKCKPTFPHPHHVTSLPVIIQRYKGAEQCHPCQKWPWIFQRLADVNSSRLAPLKRDRTPPDPPHVQGASWPPAHFRPPKRSAPCVSAPWSAPELFSSRPPAAAPTCGSPVRRTPPWRRAPWISRWRPNRRKTWWETAEETCVKCEAVMATFCGIICCMTGEI